MYLFYPSSVQSNWELIFKTTPLGKPRAVLPLSDLANLLPDKESPCGAKGWFSREGIIALMFLESYVGVSDASLIELTSFLK